MRALFALLALTLTGCTTVADMRAKAPTWTGSSSSSPRSIAVCVADEWDAPTSVFGRAPAMMRETRRGYEVSAVCGGGYPCYMVDIDSDRGGSRVAIHSQGAQSGEFEAIVRRCAR